MQATSATRPSRAFPLILVFLSSMALGAARPAAAGEGRDDDLDLGQLPGPWENHTVSLVGRVVGEGGTAPLDMHYLAAGPVDGPRIVLLHGFPDLALSWREVIPLLSGDHRVIAPDMRGYAGTGKPADGYDLQTLAADIAALIDATAPTGESGPIHLIGHDWGAAVAWAVALEYPDKLATLTAISVPHPAVMDEMLRTSPEQRRRSRYMKALASPLAPGIFAGYSPGRRARLYRGNLLRAEGFPDEVLPWYHAAFDSRAEARGPLMYYRELVRQRREARGEPLDPGPVTVPTLILWGEQDEFLMWEMAQLSCRQVDAPCELAVFADAGHFVQWEKPLGVTEIWRGFVNDALPAP
jgi:epoxide hydrolase 4